MGSLTIPQLGGKLTLLGRDSKIHVADYPVGDHHLLYSTAEIFTWYVDSLDKRYSETFHCLSVYRKKDSFKTVLIVYGQWGETHELAFTDLPGNTFQAPAGIKGGKTNNTIIINWTVNTESSMVQFPGNLFIYLLGM